MKNILTLAHDNPGQDARFQIALAESSFGGVRRALLTESPVPTVMAR